MLNQGFTYAATVTNQEHGRDALGWLSQRFPHSDVATWAARLAGGQVTSGGTPITGSSTLQRGQLVHWARPPWHEPAVPTDFVLVHRDADLLVIDKPHGLPTMPAGGFLENTLLAFVRASHPAATPVHRLGRGTSGLVIFALTERARVGLTRDLREHRVDKHYVGIIDGVPTWKSLGIEVPIGEVAHARLGTVFGANPSGRPACSVVNVLPPSAEQPTGGTVMTAPTTRVTVQIYTGRPHQIRIHLAAVGHPLAGDPLYGPGGTPRSDALPGDHGYFLHAERVVLTHPGHGGRLQIVAPPPF